MNATLTRYACRASILALPIIAYCLTGTTPMTANDPAIRSDIQQLFTARERAQARINARAAELGTANRAYLWGMEGVMPPIYYLGGGGLPLYVTALGNWSTNGKDVVGAEPDWLICNRHYLTETVDGETEESNTNYVPIVRLSLQYRMEVWTGGVKTAFDWRSEYLPLDTELNPDLFTFRYWNTYPDTENTTLEDDSIGTSNGVWLEPIVPPPLGDLGSAPSDDPEMVMAGFAYYQEVQDNFGARAKLPIWSPTPASVTPATITASQNNYNPGVCARFLKLSTNASRNLTGLTFPYPGQVDGEAHVIVNVGSNDIVLLHNQASSDAANRFYHVGGTDITLGPDDQADIWYDDTANRWRMSKRN